MFKALLKIIFQVFCIALVTGFLSMLVVYTDYYSGENSESDLFTFIMLSGLLLSAIIIMIPFFKWLFKSENTKEN